MKPQESITIVWHVEDVLSRNSDLSRKEAFEVLLAIKDNHDAEVGVNWDAIDAHIDQKLSSRN